MLMLNPGEVPVITEDIFDFVDRTRDTENLFTGASSVIASLTSKIAVPLFGSDDMQQRLSGLSPELWGHPLTWLPTWLINEITHVSPDGAQTAETRDEWAYRIANHLWVAGLVDSDTGLWADVLAKIPGARTPDGAVSQGFTQWVSRQSGEFDAVALDELFARQFMEPVALAAHHGAHVARRAAEFYTLSSIVNFIEASMEDLEASVIDVTEYVGALELSVIVSGFVTGPGSSIAREVVEILDNAGGLVLATCKAARVDDADELFDQARVWLSVLLDAMGEAADAAAEDAEQARAVLGEVSPRLEQALAQEGAA